MNIKQVRSSLCGAVMAILAAAPALEAHGGMMGMEGMDHGKMDAKMLQHMRSSLSLSADQFDRVKAEVQSHHAACQVVLDKMAKDRKALKALVNEKAADDRLVPALDALREDRKAMRDQMDRHEAALREILNLTQQAKEALGMPGHGKAKSGAAKKMSRSAKQAEKDKTVTGGDMNGR